MDDAVLQRICRIHAAIGSIEEVDLEKLRATVIHTRKIKAVFQDFRNGFSDNDLSNQVHSVIHNIANLRDHLRRWAARNGQDKAKAKVDETIDNCLELQIVTDLSNNDKHGYPPRNGGCSKRLPQLLKVDRVMQLRPQGKKGSRIAMTIGADGIPKVMSDGTAKAVVTGDVVDNDGNRIGDLYAIANKAVQAWEALLVDFGLFGATNGN